MQDNIVAYTERVMKLSAKARAAVISGNFQLLPDIDMQISAVINSIVAIGGQGHDSEIFRTIRAAAAQNREIIKAAMRGALAAQKSVNSIYSNLSKLSTYTENGEIRETITKNMRTGRHV